MFELNSPLNIQVELTDNCNHRCFYCYNSWQLNKEPAVISEKNLDKFVTIIVNEIKPFHVTITGGEPLFYFDKVKFLVKELNKKGIFTNINTNLTKISEKKIRELKKISNFGILTSLPSYKKELYKTITKSNTLDTFFANLKIIVENKIPVTVNMVVHTLNYKDVFNQGKFLYKNYNVRNFAATPVICPAYDDIKMENYELDNDKIIHVLRSLLKLNNQFNLNVDSLETLPRCLLPEDLLQNNLMIFSRACSAGRSTLSIDYNGYVRACSHSPLKECNIFENTFSVVWEKFINYRKNKFVPYECIDCLEFNNCNGGCRFYDYQAGNSLSKKDPRMTKPVSIDLVRKIMPYPKFNDTTLFYLNKNLKFRKEKENLYVFFNGDFRNVILVDENFKDFILMISKPRLLSFSNICADLKIKEENKYKLKKMFGLLIAKNYLLYSDAP